MLLLDNFCLGCYGLEKCLSEFDLVDIQPGTKLWNLGLRRVDLTGSELTRQRNELEQMQVSIYNSSIQNYLFVSWVPFPQTFSFLDHPVS